MDSRHASFQSKRDLKIADKEILASSLEATALSGIPSRYCNPIAYRLARVDWAVFGTLTFRVDYLAENTVWAVCKRREQFGRLMTAMCAEHGLRPRNLLYYTKTEWGGGGRGHLNVLIGRRGTENVPPVELAETMQRFWTTGPMARGTAKVEAFRLDWHLEGILYQTKYEFDFKGNQLPTYEEFSPMLLRSMKAQL